MLALVSPVQSFPGQLCPVLVVSPSQAAPLGSVEHQHCSCSAVLQRENTSFPWHQSCWSLASKPGKVRADFYNLCPTTFASILVLQTHGISQTQFRALFLHSSVSPYETTPQLKAKQRKKKHPGRKKHLQYLKAVSFIPTAYVVLSNHL